MDMWVYKYDHGFVKWVTFKTNVPDQVMLFVKYGLNLNEFYNVCPDGTVLTLFSEN